MERICRLELLAGVIDWEPTRKLLAMLNDPISILVAGLCGLPREDDSAVAGHRVLVPLEQTPPDDLRGLGLRRHNDSFPKAIKQLAESLVIG